MTLLATLHDKHGDGYSISGRSEIFTTIEDAYEFHQRVQLSAPLQTQDNGWYERVYEGTLVRGSDKAALYARYNCYQPVLVICGVCAVWLISAVFGAYAAAIDSNCYRFAVRKSPEPENRA